MDDFGESAAVIAVNLPRKSSYKTLIANGCVFVQLSDLEPPNAMTFSFFHTRRSARSVARKEDESTGGSRESRESMSYQFAPFHSESDIECMFILATIG